GQAAQGGQGSDPAITGTVPADDIFLRLNVSKGSVVKGEPITAVLKFYTRVDVSGFEDVKFPSFTGFWSKSTFEPQNIEFNRENVDGRLYNVAVIRRYMLIPQQEGNLTIEPAQMVCQVRVRNSSGGRSIFDDFFDSYQTIRKRVEAKAVTVKVAPLPSGAPASFAGGVGQYSVSAKFSTDSISAGEAASLVVTVSGKGNLSMLSAPKIDFPSDFEMYDVKSTDHSDATGTGGSKTFEYPFIARSYGDFKIGPIQYSYYDVSQGKYVTVSAPESSIKVSAGAQGTAEGIATAAARLSVKDIGSDIRFIATGDGHLRRAGKFMVTSPLFFALLAAIVMSFFVASVLIRRGRSRRADVAAMRNRRAEKMVRGRLKVSEDYLRRGLDSAYYEELHKAILTYVADKLTMEPATLNKENISEKLGDKGVSPETIDRLMNVIDACEMARYAPYSTSQQNEDLFATARRTILEVDASISRAAKVKGSRGRMAVLAVLLLLSAPFAATAGSADGQWEEAAAFYSEGNYQSALDIYKTIEEQGLCSDRLFYNMGNAYYKMGNLSGAILYYNKSLKLNPANADARFNLGIASESVLDRIDEVPEFVLKTVVRNIKYLMSSDGWAWTMLALLLVTALCVLGFRFFNALGLRKVSFITGCITLLMAVASLGFSLSERADIRSEDGAVVMTPVSSVKSSPAEDGKSLFIIHEGTRVEILDRLGNWSKVEIADGRQGWMASGDLEII
ncbi:MAG: BatD family protein, partial [Bacteroidales bacterium]|nr:BatD family protein [Bacteroidales bacterium]